MALFGKKKQEITEGQEVTSETEQAQPTSLAESKRAAASLPVSTDVQAMTMILGPHMTEKAERMNARNAYVFKVAFSANKIEIKRSIEKLYKVKVSKIAIVNIPAKRRRIGRNLGWKAGYKKAIITLQEGHTINQTA